MTTPMEKVTSMMVMARRERGLWLCARVNTEGAEGEESEEEESEEEESEEEEGAESDGLRRQLRLASLS